MTTSSPSSAGFFDATGVNVHGTGAVTRDAEQARERQLQAIRVLHKCGALDLLEMLFAPMQPTNWARK